MVISELTTPADLDVPQPITVHWYVEQLDRNYSVFAETVNGSAGVSESFRGNRSRDYTSRERDHLASSAPTPPLAKRHCHCILDLHRLPNCGWTELSSENEANTLCRQARYILYLAHIFSLVIRQLPYSVSSFCASNYMYAHALGTSLLVSQHEDVQAVDLVFCLLTSLVW